MLYHGLLNKRPAAGLARLLWTEAHLPRTPPPHRPRAQAIWHFDGIYASSRHIPGVRFAGLIHPGLIGEPAVLGAKHHLCCSTPTRSGNVCMFPVATYDVRPCAKTHTLAR